MLKDFVKEIPELNRDNVHIKDKNYVNNVINELIKGGSEKLQIVSDFDLTITKQHENGKRHISSFRMFNHCPSVTRKFIDETVALANKYMPIEFDPIMPVDEKKKFMEEWWTKSEQAVMGLSVPPLEIDEVAATIGPSLRDGSLNLFETLYKKKVPLLVFSAGLGDVIVSVLKHYNALLPNVKVVSNFLKFDNEGVIQGFQDSQINIFNKNERTLKGTDYYATILSRDNVILMGDSLGDAKMADGIDHLNQSLKIGFLYEHVEKNLPVYTDTFDIVLEDDQTMDVIRAILNYIP